MKKYSKAFLLSLQTTLQYRANLVMWWLVEWLSPLVSLVIWFVVLGDRSGIAGYSRGDLVTYYISMSLSWYVVGGTFGGRIGSQIKSGAMNKTLTMPYHLVWDAFIGEQAWKLVSFVLSLPLILGVIIWGREYFVVGLNWIGVGEFLIAAGLGATLFALMEAMIGATAFWLVETWPVAEVVGVLRNLFGGLLAPMVLLPSYAQTISQYLPFRYMFYLPVSIISGKAENIGQDIVIQGLFVLILYGLFRWVWSRGVTKYEAVGG